MALINYAVREISAKIVYYGPGLSGKTTNIKYIHSRVQPESRGKLVSLATETDRTLFFDFFPIEFGKVGGFNIRFHFYTVPGQVFYNTTRKLVLKGADGVVFVADSQKDMEDSNIESLLNLKENLLEIGLNLDEIPFVIQYNKRDLDELIPIESLQKDLNPNGIPYLEASALTGDGVMETMKTVSKMVLKKISRSKSSGIKKVEKEIPKEAVIKKEEVFDIPPPPPPPPNVAAAQQSFEDYAKPQAAVDLGETPIEAVKVTDAQLKVQSAAPKTGTKGITLSQVRINLDEANSKSIQKEIVLPSNISDLDNLSVSLPLVLQVHKGAKAVKLKANFTISYLDKDDNVLNALPAPKKRGFFSRLFGG